MAGISTKIHEYIDSTLLKPEATAIEVRRLCEEAADNQFATVCISPFRLGLAREILTGSGVKLCTVVGFPLGSELTRVKEKQVQCAMDLGAQEIDMVMNLGLFKDANYRAVREEIQAMAELVHGREGILKIIIETGFLSPDEIKLATTLVAAGGGDFVKTCTGFGPRGATARDIRTIKSVAPRGLKIKASGGIRKLAQMLELIELGADRIGTSSAGAIMEEYRKIGT